MKLNNKGFAISSIMYIILVFAVTLIALTLAILSSRKLVLDKLRSEVTDIIYEQYSVTYREALNTLKEEIIMYASSNNIEKDSVKISEFETTIDSNDLKGYKLSDKYLTVVSNNNSYDVFLGEAETLEGSATLPENTIDISDYKIYGNTYQETSVQGKNLFSISNRTLGTLTSPYDPISVREFEFDKYYVGLTMNNYYYPSKVISYSVSCENINVKVEAAGYGIGVPIKVKSNTTYSLSAVTEGVMGIGFYTSSGEHINDSYNMTFTTPENCEILTVVLRPNPDIDTEYSNIQLEEGSTATQYEKFSPNMPSPDFPSEVLSVGDKTKNLYEKKKENLSSNDAYIGLDMRDWEKTAYTLQLRLKEGKTIPANTYFGFLYSDTAAFWLIENGTVNSNYPELIKTINMSTLNGVACYPSSNIEAIWDAFDIFLVKGDYTTETIPPYEPYDKYKIPVKVGGKNLLPYPYTKTTMTVNGITYTDLGDGGINVNGTSSTWASFNLYIGESNPFEAGKKYTFSKNQIGEGNVSFLLYYLDENGAGKWAASGILWKEEYTFDHFYLQVDPDVTIDNVTLYPQVEEGTVATPYEPYVGSVTTNIYLDNPLRKIETSTDNLNFYNRQIERQVGKEVNFAYYNPNGTITPNGFYGAFFLTDPIMKKGTKLAGFCNVLPSNIQYWKEWDHEQAYFGQVNTAIYIITKNYYETWEEMENYLTNGGVNELNFYYQKQNNSYETLDLPRIQTISGKVRLSIDTEIEPSKFEFTVIKKIKQL